MRKPSFSSVAEARCATAAQALEEHKAAAENAAKEFAARLAEKDAVDED